MRMLIMGPPGCGKGTQAERLSRRLGITVVSTGEVFRDHVKNLTPLGREVIVHLDAGDLVPDTLTNRVVRDRLNQNDVKVGFLLDGYPRNTAQLAELDFILAANGQELDVAVQLTVDDAELVRRMLHRATIDRTQRRYRGRHPAPFGALPPRDRAGGLSILTARDPPERRRHGKRG